MAEPVSIDMSAVAENLANRVGALTLQLTQMETAFVMVQAQVAQLTLELQAKNQGEED